MKIILFVTDIQLNETMKSGDTAPCIYLNEEMPFMGQTKVYVPDFRCLPITNRSWDDGLKSDPVIELNVRGVVETPEGDLKLLPYRDA